MNENDKWYPQDTGLVSKRYLSDIFRVSERYLCCWATTLKSPHHQQLTKRRILQCCQMV